MTVLERLVASSSRLTERVDRRGVLARGALVGTAVAVAPAAFLLETGEAYASICSCRGSSCDCNALCCDGYTEFCCTTSGVNQCPPGTLTGGWWKVDGSNFCGGSARYYVDCNANAGSCGCGSNGIAANSCTGTTCSCASGCDHRKTGCTQFRYGQCHTNVPCLGPIVCRVVTCTPPWQTDAACATGPVLQDDNTRYHDAACLHDRPPVGSVDGVTAVEGGLLVQGWAYDPDSPDNALVVSVTLDGRQVATTTANQPRPDVARARGAGGGSGFRVQIPVTAGSHSVCVNAAPTQLGCRSITLNAPVGSFDDLSVGLDGVHVAGWAWDRDTGDSAVVTITDQRTGRVVTTLTANTSRPDVGHAQAGAGDNRGFETTLPLTVLSGLSTTFCVTVADSTKTLAATSLGCRTATTSIAGRPVTEGVDDGRTGRGAGSSAPAPDSARGRAAP